MFGKKRRKHEKSILDNPEEFFNSMSREEFKAFLEEFGFEYIDLEDININDVAKRCGKYCSDCIVPCSTCHMGKCEQCRYGYESVVEKLLEKFTAEQLTCFKDKCPYAKLAVDGEDKEEKEIDNVMINESYMDSPEAQCDRCNNSDICKYKDQVIEVNNKISEVVFNEELPIEINVNCKKFVAKKSGFR